MSFQNVRETLVYCLADEIIDEDEFHLLYDPYESENVLSILGLRRF